MGMGGWGGVGRGVGEEEGGGWGEGGSSCKGCLGKLKGLATVVNITLFELETLTNTNAKSRKVAAKVSMFLIPAGSNVSLKNTEEKSDSNVSLRLRRCRCRGFKAF